MLRKGIEISIELTILHNCVIISLHVDGDLF